MNQRWYSLLPTDSLCFICFYLYRANTFCPPDFNFTVNTSVQWSLHFFSIAVPALSWDYIKMVENVSFKRRWQWYHILQWLLAQCINQAKPPALRVITGHTELHFTRKFHETVMSDRSSKTHISQFVKASEKLVEKFDQLLSAARRRQLREADDVCKQNTAQRRRGETAL